MLSLHVSSLDFPTPSRRTKGREGKKKRRQENSYRIKETMATTPSTAPPAASRGAAGLPGTRFEGCSIDISNSVSVRIRPSWTCGACIVGRVGASLHWTRLLATTTVPSTTTTPHRRSMLMSRRPPHTHMLPVHPRGIQSDSAQDRPRRRQIGTRTLASGSPSARAHLHWKSCCASSTTRSRASGCCCTRWTRSMPELRSRCSIWTSKHRCSQS